ncbi:hypothetical protein CEXT_763741 [Caerostris extrusa]|uniref:Uncharacterized protein n=1 Tax=Caerostris extrusa TaxID=172846 RepID=A0AAV4WC08_CAEEX|nr:hypothetical protein CEXT_763741 [Caerostris extrusa]
MIECPFPFMAKVPSLLIFSPEIFKHLEESIELMGHPSLLPDHTSQNMYVDQRSEELGKLGLVLLSQYLQKVPETGHGMMDYEEDGDVAINLSKTRRKTAGDTPNGNAEPEDGEPQGQICKVN